MNYTSPMAYELITSWGDYQNAIDRILTLGERRLWIFDPDLAQLKLEQASRAEALRRLLRANRDVSLRIAVQDARPLRDHSPHLIALLRDYQHCMQVVETGPNLAGLRDCMLLADDCHGLIRFDLEQPRSKLLVDEAAELQPYFNRFDALWQEGGTPVSATTLGL